MTTPVEVGSQIQAFTPHPEPLLLALGWIQLLIMLTVAIAPSQQ